MKKRTFIEILSVLVLVFLGFISLTTSSQKDTKYTLDEGNIVYKGDLLKNKFDGNGQLKLKNNDQYIGGFQAGQFSGKGTFISHDNWKYVGQFKGGVPNGSGILSMNNHEYKANFNKGKILTNEN